MVPAANWTVPSIAPDIWISFQPAPIRPGICRPTTKSRSFDLRATFVDNRVARVATHRTLCQWHSGRRWMDPDSAAPEWSLRECVRFRRWIVWHVVVLLYPTCRTKSTNSSCGTWSDRWPQCSVDCGSRKPFWFRRDVRNVMYGRSIRHRNLRERETAGRKRVKQPDRWNVNWRMNTYASYSSLLHLASELLEHLVLNRNLRMTKRKRKIAIKMKSQHPKWNQFKWDRIRVKR